MQDDLDRITWVTSAGFRSQFTGAWRKIVEINGILGLTVHGQREFLIFPIHREVVMVHVPVITLIVSQVFTAGTGIEVSPGYETYLPAVGPEKLRRNLGSVRRKMRQLMVPFYLTYYRKVHGAIFPIPYDADDDTIRAMINAWYSSAIDRV